MSNSKYSILFVVIVGSLFSGCMPPARQSSTFSDMMAMQASRRDINDYKQFRTQFINYARSSDAENLLLMMAPNRGTKPELVTLFEKDVFPFFSDYKEVTGNVVNMIQDQHGNPGYTLYEFIKTAEGETKPFGIAIVEKDNKFLVNNIVINKCIKQFHYKC